MSFKLGLILGIQLRASKLSFRASDLSFGAIELGFRASKFGSEASKFESEASKSDPVGKFQLQNTSSFYLTLHRRGDMQIL